MLLVHKQTPVPVQRLSDIERVNFSGPWRLSRDGSSWTRMDDIGQIYVFWVKSGTITVI